MSACVADRPPVTTARLTTPRHVAICTVQRYRTAAEELCASPSTLHRVQVRYKILTKFFGISYASCQDTSGRGVGTAP